MLLLVQVVDGLLARLCGSDVHLDEVAVPTMAAVTKISCRLGLVAQKTVANVF